MQIGNQDVQMFSRPYVIAELSANHESDYDVAAKSVIAAKEAGASAIKFQAYTADTITLNSHSDYFQIKEGPWSGSTLFDLYRSASMPWSWYEDLFSLARDQGIDAFASVFDFSSVDLMHKLGAPAIKIASFEIVDLPLIEYAASTGIPMIISTGIANEREIGDAMEAASSNLGKSNIALLHCVSSYPALASEYHLATIPHMAEKFEVPVGLSDHTIGNATGAVAASLGAPIFEKHFTLDRDGGSADDFFSADVQQFKQYVIDIGEGGEAIGGISFELKGSESFNIKFRRSLFFVEGAPAGSAITREMIRSVRPGDGLPPKFHEALIGRKLARDVSANSPVTLEDISGEIDD